MPSNPVPNLSQEKLKRLRALLNEYAQHIHGEQPLAAAVIALVVRWIADDIND